MSKVLSAVILVTAVGAVSSCAQDIVDVSPVGQASAGQEQLDAARDAVSGAALSTAVPSVRQAIGDWSASRGGNPPITRAELDMALTQAGLSPSITVTKYGYQGTQFCFELLSGTETAGGCPTGYFIV
jgi:hypothetical protein